MITPIYLVKVSLSQDRLTVSRRTREEERRKEISVNIENRLVFSVKLSKAEYSMWNKTEQSLQQLAETPWLDLIDFPLRANSCEDNILQSSGLIKGNVMLRLYREISPNDKVLTKLRVNGLSLVLTGLTEMYPDCRSLSCLVSSCPASAELQHFCQSVLGRGVVSQPGYPRQLSSNYITFSRDRLGHSHLL